MAVKTILKAGAALGAGALGLGALVYEGALNTRVIPKFKEIFNKPDPELESLYNGEYYTSCCKWFEENKGEDHKILDEKAESAHAYIIMSETPTNKWAVINHGYTSDPTGTSPYAKHYHEKGYNVITPSLRGFGNDEKHYCSMGWQDKYICLAWVKYIAAVYPDADILIHGYSMGAATTMLTLGEDDLPANVKCAVSDCGYTNCYEQYADVLKTNASLPAFPIIDLANIFSVARGNFDIKKNSPVDAVKKSTTPTLFIHGDADTFVPFYMLQKVYDACSAPKEKLVVEGAMHAVSVLKNPELYWTTADRFIAKYM